MTLGDDWLKAVVLLACAGASSALAAAADVYVTPSGSAVGNCTAGVHDAAWFNNSGNWGTGAAQIGPDTVVHVCGTFTGTQYTVPGLAFRGSGTQGHPITLKAEPGFLLTSPVWGPQGNAAMTSYGYSHLVMDGNGVGIIENTANGGGLGNQLNSNAIYLQGGSDVTIRGWTIRNICRHQQGVNGSGCSSGGSDDAAIFNNGDSNVTVTQCTIHDSMGCIIENAASNSAGNAYTSNTLVNCNWGIAVGAADTGHLSAGVNVSFNDISGAVTWDEPDDGFHHNGVFLYVGQGAGQVNDPVVDGNFIHGDMGVYDTSYIFIDPNSGSVNRPIVVNNVLASTSAHAPANAFITGDGNVGGVLANNTISGNGVNTGEGCIADNFGNTGATLVNNICAATSRGVFLNNPSTIQGSDHNVLFGFVSGTAMQNQATGYATVAQWTQALGFDSHSVTGNPALDASFRPSTASPALGAGQNLSALNIPALSVDRAGVARPSTGPWTIGAYQGQGTASGPSAPSALQANVH